MYFCSMCGTLLAVCHAIHCQLWTISVTACKSHATSPIPTLLSTHAAGCCRFGHLSQGSARARRRMSGALFTVWRAVKELGKPSGSLSFTSRKTSSSSMNHDFHVHPGGGEVRGALTLLWLLHFCVLGSDRGPTDRMHRIHSTCLFKAFENGVPTNSNVLLLQGC